jgi:hypothetical protein
MDDLISRQAAIAVANYTDYRGLTVEDVKKVTDEVIKGLRQLPSAQSDIAEKLYLCKCYVTDEEGLQHEVIHTGDIRRITGWEI